MSTLLKLTRINQHEKFLTLTYVIFLKREIVRYSRIDQAVIHTALNTPIIFHEPYGLPMLGCLYGVTMIFFDLHYICAAVLQFSAQIEASLLDRHWAHSVAVIHTLTLQLDDENIVCCVNNLIPSIFLLREKKCMKRFPGENVHIKDKFNFFICTAAPCSYHLLGELLSSLPETH